MRYAALALLERPGVDLRDVMKLFIYKGFRRQVTESISDPQVRFFLKHEFPAMNYQTSADGVAPIANKLGAFLAHPTVRTALCEPKQPLRFRRTMDQGDILLVNLAKGHLGADIGNILGGFITSSIMQAAFTRQDQALDERRPFFLYVDEFHSLTTKAFAGLLSEARKYGLGLVLAHQYLTQTDAEVRDAIIGNVGTMIVYRLGATDAPFFERLLWPFSARDLQNQPNYHASVWLRQNGEPMRPFSAAMHPPCRRAKKNNHTQVKAAPKFQYHLKSFNRIFTHKCSLKSLDCSGDILSLATMNVRRVSRRPPPLGTGTPKSGFYGSVEPYFAVRTLDFGPTRTESKNPHSTARNRGILRFELSD
ncbi:MAG: type IV secretory system conjugative DNA transfer family protein [Pseudomonadota bacterium]